MVTVSPGRSCSSTRRAARRVTVPSASSSPEHATIPTFRCGSSGMVGCLLAGDQVVDDGGDLRGHRMRQLLAALVQLGDALRLQLPVPPVHIEHRDALGDLPSALLHHLGGAGELAPVDGHRRMCPDGGTGVLVTQDQEREGHEARGPRPQILGDLVGSLAADGAVRLADAAARHHHDLAFFGAHSFFASSSAWPFISSKYACGSSSAARSVGQSTASMTASHPSPYGSWLMASGDSSIAGFTSTTLPPTGEATSTLALIVSITASSSPVATAVPAGFTSAKATSPLSC